MNSCQRSIRQLLWALFWLFCTAIYPVNASSAVGGNLHGNYHKPPSTRAFSDRRRLVTAPGHNPSIGSYKVLVLLIEFTDDTHRKLVNRTFIRDMWTGIISDWHRVNSHGLYHVDPVVTNWTLTDNTEEHYSFGDSGYNYDIQKMGWPVLDKLDNRSDWNWSQFDLNHDGFIDAAAMMHSGYSAIPGGIGCSPNHLGPKDRIWDHTYEGSIPPYWTSSDGSVRLYGYTIASVYKGRCDTQGPLTPGILTHEFMHTMGLVDIYDPTFLGNGVGFWCIMADPYGTNALGLPGLLSSWSRMAAKWLTPTMIEQDGTFRLRALALEPDAYRINLRNNSDGSPAEYLLIENRQQLLFDLTLPAAGLIIYHVDNAADGQANRGWPGQKGWPQNGNHYQLAVLQKDGNYDLEQGNNMGDAGDMWMPGDILGPGHGNTVFPNTDSYQNGTIKETGIKITVLSQNGTDMLFRVGGLGGSGSSGVVTTIPPATRTIAPINIAADEAGSPSTPRPPVTPPVTSVPTVSQGTPTASPMVSTTASPTASPMVSTTASPTALPMASPTASPMASPTISPMTGPFVTSDNPTQAPVFSVGNFWVLTRAPIPTRNPAQIPKFPVGTENLLGSSANHATCWGWPLFVATIFTLYLDAVLGRFW